MIEERTVHPLDYLSVLRRRQWWLIVPFVACVVIGALLALFLPRTYLSQAQIGVAAPTLSPQLLRGVSSLDKEERQRAISQQLLSPAVLQRVVREEKIKPAQPVEEVAAWLRGNVERNISVPRPIGRADSGSKGLDSFILGYTDSDPQRAQRITNRLAYVFVEENSKRQTERAENTSEVLGQQLRNSQDRLSKLEDELRQKKEAYMGRLPDQVNANVQMVNGLRSQLESISNQLRGEQDRLSLIESRLDAMREGTGTVAMTSAATSTIQGAQARVLALQKQLAQARSVYTNKHPEIQRLETELAAAREDLVAQRKRSPDDRDELLQADPAFRQLLQERDASRLRVRDLERASTQARSQITVYQARVDAAPMVEQELASLQRQYELEKVRFSDLTKQYNSAQMAEDLTRKQGGERFSVLYPASLPDTPISPQPLKIMGLALAAGLVLGGVLAIGREFIDRSVHDVRALQSEFEVPVLGEIPHITA
jgi:polysaccharide chain length determinant protein (PEP-CTERM system associated)